MISRVEGSTLVDEAPAAFLRSEWDAGGAVASVARPDDVAGEALVEGGQGLGGLSGGGHARRIALAQRRYIGRFPYSRPDLP
jgi:hypothetical protein